MKTSNYIKTIMSLIVTLILLMGCGQATPQIVKETVEVEKIVKETVEVEKIVKETVIVEATAQPAAVADETPVSDKVNIVVWAEPWTARHMVENPDKDGKYGLKLKEMFEEQNPGYTVSIEDHSWDNELRQNLMTAIMAGTAPDVVVSENFFKQYVELGAIIPLDDYIKDIKADLIPGTYRAAEIDGKVYGISSFTGVFGFERNCEVVIAAGLDCDKAPATWDELLKAAKTINEKGNGKYYGFTIQGPQADSVGSVFRIAVFLAQSGATLCQNDCNYPYFNDPKAIPAYELLRELNKLTPPGLTFEPDEGKTYTQLFEGKSAFQIAGSWHPKWASGAGCKDCRYSGVPVPADGKPASLIVGNGIYAVLKQSKHPEQAANFVKLLASPEAQDLIFSAMGRFPTTYSAVKKLRPTVDTATQAYMDELVNNPDLQILPSWPKNPQLVWTAYNTMLTEILTTDRPIAEILDEGQAAAEEAVK